MAYKQKMPIEFQLFADVWNFFGKFYEASSSLEYWEKAVAESTRIYEQYDSPLCKDLLVAIMKELQRKGEVTTDESI